MQNKLPSYFNSKQIIILLILAAVLFGELFFLYALPFDSRPLQLTIAVLILIPYLLITFVVLKFFNNSVPALTEQEKKQKFHFYDEKGDLKLSICSDRVYILEAADNYVTIYYLANDKMEKMMIRNSLRNMEWRFAQYGLIRCHRSYIINIHLVQVVRCQEGEVMVDFGDNRFPNIPVSKGYAEKVMGEIAK